MMENEYAAPEDTWPQPGSSGSGTTFGYSVEARYANAEPKAVGPITLDLRWQRLHFPAGHGGVRQRAGSIHDAATYGFHTLSSAQALRHWFLAEAELEAGVSFCIETRIIEHKITYSFSDEAVAALDLVQNDGLRDLRAK